jgi:hypothetical protein
MTNSPERGPLGSVQRAYQDGYAAAQHEIERLRAALDVLKELHTLLDFEEPLTDEKPWLFEDATDINAAFAKAYAVIVAERAIEQKVDRQ